MAQDTAITTMPTAEEIEAEEADSDTGYGSYEAVRAYAGLRAMHFANALAAYYENR